MHEIFGQSCYAAIARVSQTQTHGPSYDSRIKAYLQYIMPSAAEAGENPTYEPLAGPKTEKVRIPQEETGVSTTRHHHFNQLKNNQFTRRTIEFRGPSMNALGPPYLNGCSSYSMTSLIPRNSTVNKLIKKNMLTNTHRVATVSIEFVAKSAPG